MKVRHFAIYQLSLPFRAAFQHARKKRKSSESIVVRCELEDGTVGFGESLPRTYVTGESWGGCYDDLGSKILPALLDCDFSSYSTLQQFCSSLYGYLKADIRGLPRRIGAACCAVELALLDAFGRHFGETSFAGSPNQDPTYSGVVSSSSRLKAAIVSWQCSRMALPSVKLKVGTERDLDLARIARRVLGARTILRADANMAWQLETAIKRILQLREFGIDYIEQPIQVGQPGALRDIQESTGASIIADEDLCDIEDAEQLIAADACRVFNIRISKCGGFFNSLRIGRLAQSNGIEVQIGCQVGESALLSAVGLAAARQLAPVVFAEGCFGGRLLGKDLQSASGSEAAIPFEFGYGGAAPTYAPSRGIGIGVDEVRLNRYARARRVIRRSGRVGVPTRGAE